MGGGLYDDTPGNEVTYSDVWQFDSSESWTQLTASYGGVGVIYHTAVYWPAQGVFLLSNGYNSVDANLNQLWSSTDGITWMQQSTNAAKWLETHADTITVSTNGAHVFRQGGVETFPGDNRFQAILHRISPC